MNKASLIALALLAAVCTAASADVIQLRDGRSFSGTLSRDGKSSIINVDGGETLTVASDQVKSVTMVSTITPAQAATAEWTRVAVLIKKSDDLATVISLHQKFLEKFPNQAESENVRASLDEYLRLQRQNGVKFRGRWMPAAQVDVTLRQWEESAQPALTLYKAGRLRDALASAKDAIKNDSLNSYALEIAGLASYRLNNLFQARDYFLAMAAADPSSVLAENNLGVVFAQQKKDSDSVIHYTRALQAMPDNRLVLDNIIEELATFSGDKNGTIYEDLIRQFEQAETRMEALMLTKGLVRYGSTWVTKQQYDQVAGAQRDIQSAMKQLDAQYKSATSTYATLDDAIKQTQAQYDNTVNALSALDFQIAVQQDRGGDVWFLLSQRDTLLLDADRLHKQLLAMAAQRDQINATFKDFYAQADKLKAALKIAQASEYTGIQRIMDVGEDENPPAPTVMIMPPPLPPAPQLLPPGPVPVIIVHDNSITPDDNDQTELNNDYQRISTPLGVPLFPVNNGQGHHHDDGHGSHDGPVIPTFQYHHDDGHTPTPGGVNSSTLTRTSPSQQQ